MAEGLAGAGADIAAWISYAVSKKFSKEPEKFGTGTIEGVAGPESANNAATLSVGASALAGATGGKLYSLTVTPTK